MEANKNEITEIKDQRKEKIVANIELRFGDEHLKQVFALK